MDINRNNYETFFLLYLDGELNPAERTEVENFLTTHADLQKEFSLLQFTIQRPADIIFEPKELLYRREEKRRVIPIYWSRIAASVLLFLAASWFLLTLFNNHKLAISDKEQKVAVLDDAKNHPVADSHTKKNQAKQQQPTDADPLQTMKSKSDIETDPNHATSDFNKVQPDNTLAKKTNKPVNNKNKKESRDQLNHSVEQQPGDRQNVQDQQYQTNPGSQIQDATGDGAIVMQKSNAHPELQASGSRSTEPVSGQLAGGVKSPALLIAAEGRNQPANKESEQLTDMQTDNAISVIALNDRNKAITGFFKKLTKRVPGNETADNTKKLRVSVFQFSY